MKPSSSMKLLGSVILSALIMTAAGVCQDPSDDGDPPSHALDKLLLKSGAEIRGQILQEVTQEGRTYVLFRTENGGLLKLERGQVVRRSYPAEPIEKEYHAKVTDLPDNTDSHWTMYQWLSRQKGGAVRFKHERDFHLRRIIELDPTDERALNLLDFQNLDGQWVDKDLLHAYHGYVSDGGKWMPQLQLQVNQRAEQKKQAKGDRNGELKRWNRYVLGNENPSVVQKQLYALVDANSLDLVAKMMAEEKRPDVRRLFVEAIGRLPTSYAQSLLVKYAILDGEAKVRDRAITMLQQPHYVPFQSTTIAAGYLASPENLVVRRTARLIGILGADNGPFYLKQVLVTKHKTATGNQPGRTQGSFSNSGDLQSFGAGGGPTHKLVEVQNHEALDALRIYSGQDFGFDVNRWKKWFIENHMTTEEDIRRDH